MSTVNIIISQAIASDSILHWRLNECGFVLKVS